MLFSFLLLFSLFSLNISFKWKVNDSLDPLQILTLSERFMFSTKNGPILLKQGESFIYVKTEILFMMNVNTSTTLKYAIYATDYEHSSDSIGLCGDTLTNYPWASNTLVRTVPSVYEETRRNPLNNALVYFYRAKIHKKYEVRAETWHNVAFQICSGESQLIEASLTGTVEFHNPYGYIPAELYGIFPFEAARVLAFLILTIYYIYLFRTYESSILPLHKAIFVVLFVALAEATVWFAAYQKINITGTPYCCPFPPLVIGALIMQLLRQALSRCLLLVVSLGYGIVRPKLLWVEWISVIVITLLYFTIATSYEVSNIVSLDVHPNSSPKTAGMLLPSMFIDLLFLSWIYLALSSTIRILTEFQQTHKLKMYERLYNTIATFSVLFILISFLMSMKTSGVLKFPWQWEWMQQVSWEVLNFSALAVVCIICSPSDNSRLLSYVSQLPTEDPDGDDEDGNNGIQLTGPQSYSNYSDSDSDEKPKIKSSIQSNGKNSSPNKFKTSSSTSSSSPMYSLPTADDEDEYTI